MGSGSELKQMDWGRYGIYSHLWDTIQLLFFTDIYIGVIWSVSSSRTHGQEEPGIQTTTSMINGQSSHHLSCKLQFDH